MLMRGEGESTTDLVYSGHSMICENGSTLAERKPFDKNEIIYTEIDVKRLSHERIKTTDFKAAFNSSYRYIYFGGAVYDTVLTRSFSKRPFVPEDEESLAKRADLYLTSSLPRLPKRLRSCRMQKRPSSEYPEDLIQLSRFLLLFLQWISWEKDMTILLPLQCRALVLESEPGEMRKSYVNI